MRRAVRLGEESAQFGVVAIGLIRRRVGRPEKVVAETAAKPRAWRAQALPGEHHGRVQRYQERYKGEELSHG
jgi:hypothetical protein